MAVGQTELQKALAKSTARQAEEQAAEPEVPVPTDKDHIAWLLYSEARGEGREEMKLVADTVVNRSNNSGEDYQTVIYKPKAYADTRYEEMPIEFMNADYASGANAEAWKVAYEVAEDVAEGRHQLQSHATHMNSSETPPSYWDNMETITEKDGSGHRFGYDSNGPYKGRGPKKSRIVSGMAQPIPTEGEITEGILKGKLYTRTGNRRLADTKTADDWAKDGIQGLELRAR